MMPIHVGRYLRRRGSRKAILATHTVSEYSFPEEHVLTAHVWRSGTEAVGSLFPTDILIGDDRYVFLGVESRYGFSENDVFVFDAIRLMRRGAKFRFIDIIKTQAYKDFNSALRDAELEYEHRTGVRPAWGSSRPDMVALKRELIEEDAGLKLAYAKLLARRDEITVGGEAGVRLLREWYSDPEGFMERRGLAPGEKPELLVPFKLTLEESIGTVVEETE